MSMTSTTCPFLPLFAFLLARSGPWVGFAHGGLMETPQALLHECRRRAEQREQLGRCRARAVDVLSAFGGELAQELEAALFLQLGEAWAFDCMKADVEDAQIRLPDAGGEPSQSTAAVASQLLQHFPRPPVPPVHEDPTDLDAIEDDAAPAAVAAPAAGRSRSGKTRPVAAAKKRNTKAKAKGPKAKVKPRGDDEMEDRSQMRIFKVLTEIRRILAVSESATGWAQEVLRLDASAADQLAQLAPKAFRTLAREIHPDGRSPLDEEDELLCHEALEKLQRARRHLVCCEEQKGLGRGEGRSLRRPERLRCEVRNGGWHITWQRLAGHEGSVLRYELRAQVAGGIALATLAELDPSEPGGFEVSLHQLPARVKSSLQSNGWLSVRVAAVGGRLGAAPRSATTNSAVLSEETTLWLRELTEDLASRWPVGRMDSVDEAEGWTKPCVGERSVGPF
ncbi:unnamed protein product [Durusdinium trenchii]|uniref:J domain-containing protein n=1 Tax=Durusdinium trenchii TaxID=1381693 RepID=A0ABP0QTC1_9DINO